ncbi:oxidoreductase [Sphingomonas arantia]|uniref:Oxidoreductase n=1 Tax=Sphingomonas arantia TaxID=1460676 RepID=A0ABW4TZQ7_9SPHN
MKTWFITGVSSGFGRAIAEAALAIGDTVIGTLRSEGECAEFSLISPTKSHGVLLDVTDFASVVPVVADAELRFGPIDILVNNAGYGHEGLIEESSLEDVRRQFDVNVFGAIAVAKAILPGMRQRRSGHIINMTSMGGLTTFPGLGYYHASKFALEGFSETLGKEVKDFGVFVTAVEPGAFRTDWAGRSMVRVERSITDYDALINPVIERRKAYSGHQPGNPDKAAQVIVDLTRAQDPPAHLLLGKDAWKFVHEKLDTLHAELETWRAVTESTDFEVEAA